MLLNINPYRIAINGSLLLATAEEVLANAKTQEDLANHLGWDPIPEVLEKGFAPEKDIKTLNQLLKQNEKRKKLKERRISKGYPDFKTPRKGFQGWIQKMWFDRQEGGLPISYDIIEWFLNSSRYNLVVSLHDAILGSVSIAEPKSAEFQDVTKHLNPITDMVCTDDRARFGRLKTALTCPIRKIKVEVLLNDFAGYVVHYDAQRNTAYYFG